MISYQCSQLSTSESVIEVFETANKIQSRRDHKKYVSVVVLDEVGLAEDSPNLPLKALHPLLEDGTEGAGKHDEQIVCTDLWLFAENCSSHNDLSYRGTTVVDVLGYVNCALYTCSYCISEMQ